MWHVNLGVSVAWIEINSTKVYYSTVSPELLLITRQEVNRLPSF